MRHNNETRSDSPKGDDRDRLLHASWLMLPVMRIRSVVITPKPSMRRFFYLLLALLPAPARVFHNGVHSAVAPALHHAQRAAMPAAGVSRESGRRPSRVGQVVRAELATVIRTANSVGSKRIPAGLQSMISIVDVDMSPDLRNARVKVSIIGDRKDKISAVRWLQGNTRGLRHELAKRNRGMKVIPMLSFAHVDVGAATDTMVQIEKLRALDEAAAQARGETDEDSGGIDFDAADEDAWLDEDDDDDELFSDEDVDDEELEARWASLDKDDKDR